MTNLEQRLTELKAETEMCKVVIKMQERIDKIQAGEKSCTTALINSFIKIADTLNINSPKGAKPNNWRAWVYEWNVFCYSHKKGIYSLRIKQ